MATAPPPRRQSPVLIPGTRFLVLVGDEDGNAPTLGDRNADPPVPSDERPEFELLSYSQSAGGSRIDSIKLRYNLAKAGKRLVDVLSPVGFKRQAEVRTLDDDGDPTVIIGWGFLSAHTLQVGGGESLVIDARIEHHLFGQQLRSTPYWRYQDDDDTEGERVDTHIECVFNPEIDGRIRANRSDKRDPDVGDDDADDHPYVFIHPESMWTRPARVLQRQTASYWKLSEAVHWLCWECNPDQTYILNPTLAELQAVFQVLLAVDDGNGGTTTQKTEEEPKRLALEYGKYLPELLDTLLKPHGWTWYLTHSLNDDDERESRLVFFRRNQGDQATLKMQRPGQLLDITQTNVRDLQATISLAEMANRVTARGAKPQFETTLSLYPGWPQEDDNTSVKELVAALQQEIQPDDGDPPQLPTPTYKTLHSVKSMVYRKFVCNEAGDYALDDYRDEAGMPDRQDLSDILDDDQASAQDPNAPKTIYRRRPLLPCLSVTGTRDANGDPVGDDEGRQYVLEYWDRNQPDAAIWYVPSDKGWVRVRHSYQVLAKEGGVLFQNVPTDLIKLFHETHGSPAVTSVPHPPSNPMAEGYIAYPGLYMRITCCIESDRHDEVTLTRRANESPNGLDVELLVDFSDRLYRHEVHESSIYYSQAFLIVNRDDRARLREQAERIRNLEDAATVSCSITLPYVCPPTLAIGKLVEKLAGREIDLRGNKPESGDPRRLQIVGVNVSVNGPQQTELLLETFRLEREPTIDRY